MSKPKNIAASFHADLQALRKKYPMVYIETWQPDDFVFHEGDIDDAPAVDWNHPFHEITASNLYRRDEPRRGRLSTQTVTLTAVGSIYLLGPVAEF